MNGSFLIYVPVPMRPLDHDETVYVSVSKSGLSF
jgi:hypothetical protein